MSDCCRCDHICGACRTAGSPDVAGESSFLDVRASDYFAQAVAWVDQNGIASGTGDGQFSPNSVCTQAQIVTLLFRASA